LFVPDIGHGKGNDDDDVVCGGVLLVLLIEPSTDSSHPHKAIHNQLDSYGGQLDRTW